MVFLDATFGYNILDHNNLNKNIIRVLFKSIVIDNVRYETKFDEDVRAILNYVTQKDMHDVTDIMKKLQYQLQYDVKQPNRECEMFIFRVPDITTINSQIVFESSICQTMIGFGVIECPYSIELKDSELQELISLKNYLVEQGRLSPDEIQLGLFTNCCS